jgi:uncharacterized membrane protein YhhN
LHVLILILLLIDFAGNLVSLKKQSKIGNYVTKPLLMPLLALFYITVSKQPDTFVIFALAAGFLGDVFLLNGENPMRLKLGILSFMTGHVLYMIKFAAVVGGDYSIPASHFALLLPYLLYGVCIYRLLSRKLGPMKPMAILYLSIIILMSFKSLTVLKAGILSFIPVFIGSVFFLVSDSLLAYDIFVQKTKYADIIIMFTYAAAQMLIITGLL